MSLAVCRVGGNSSPLPRHVEAEVAPAGDPEVAVEAVRAVWPDAEIIGQWLTADELFRGGGQCKDCGDPLNGTGLMQRCRGRHIVMPA
jgi:hypothetical protein